jgi:cytochrome c peroxidase
MVIKFLSIAFMLALTACGGSDELDDELRLLASYHGLTGNPIVNAGIQHSDLESPKAQLGKFLFFSKNLSGKGDVSCATCHHPFLGGDDDLPLSIGVDAIDEDSLGIERALSEGIVLVPRNAPTTFNSSLWRQKLFHDGRVERLNPIEELVSKISTPDEEFGDIDPLATDLLQAQAGFPVTSEHEMRSNYLDRGSNHALRLNLERKMIEAVKLSTIEKDGKGSWEGLFRNAYADHVSSTAELVTFARIRDSLADYQRTQVFVDTPWKKYLEGQSSALNKSAKRGAILFFKSQKQGGADCVSCHSGDFFTDEGFHNIAMPQIGFGKELNGNDRGRYLRSGVLEDQYRFRTPSLINVTETAPYGHTGAYRDLKSTVEHHLSPATAIDRFDFENPDLLKLGILMDSSEKWTRRALDVYKRYDDTARVRLRLSDEKIADLLEYLQHLTDECVTKESCLQKWVPNKDIERFPDDSILELGSPRK